jgi:aminomuconate-semialdehyde/2-hydroxymuconate-6-semialdehyde dehydrogenase
MTLIKHVIGGREVESLDGGRFPDTNPWTRTPWAEVALGSSADAERALGAARRAFDEGPWPRLGFAERGRLLHRLADLIESHSSELAEADSRDMGKPINDMTRNDVPRAAYNFRFFADHARLSKSDAGIGREGGDFSREFFTEPKAVVMQISPS